MMQPKDYTRLKHMMEYAEEAKDLAIETTRETLATDRKNNLHSRSQTGWQGRKKPCG